MSSSANRVRLTLLGHLLGYLDTMILAVVTPLHLFLHSVRGFNLFVDLISPTVLELLSVNYCYHK